MTSSTKTNESVTNEVKPLTYLQRLIQEFHNSDNESFSSEEIESVIINFQEIEYQKKKSEASCFPFGKYRNRSIKDTIAFDLRYCQWLSKQSILDNFPELKESLNTALSK